MDKAKRTELIRAAALTMAGQYNAAALPMYGHIESLNASVAAGILFSEIAKARHA